MIIIWRGSGLLVIVLVFGSSLAANMLALSFGGKGYWETHAWPFACALMVAGILIWITDAILSNRPRKTLIEKGTGKEFILDNTPSFFFIRMRWWAFISAGIGLVSWVMNVTPGK